MLCIFICYLIFPAGSCSFVLGIILFLRSPKASLTLFSAITSGAFGARRFAIGVKDAFYRGRRKTDWGCFPSKYLGIWTSNVLYKISWSIPSINKFSKATYKTGWIPSVARSMASSLAFLGTSVMKTGMLKEIRSFDCSLSSTATSSCILSLHWDLGAVLTSAAFFSSCFTVVFSFSLNNNRQVLKGFGIPCFMSSASCAISEPFQIR